MYLIFIFYSFS